MATTKTERLKELLPQFVDVELRRNPASIIDFHQPPKDIMDFAARFARIELKPKQAEVLTEFFHGKIKYTELHLRWGRKSGKTLMSAIIILYCVYRMLQLPDPHKHYGIPPQKIYAQLVGSDKEQALDVGINYIKTLAKGSWYFKPLIVRETTTRVEFVKKICIKAQTSSGRSGRGYPSFCLFFDEEAWFLDTSGNASGSVVYNAFKPNTVLFKGDQVIVNSSSPAGEQGIFYELEQASLKEGSKILHSHGATWEINPEITRESLQDEFERDPDNAWREYGARYSAQVDAFIPTEILDRARKQDHTIKSTGDNYPCAVALDPGIKHDRYVMYRAYRKGKDIITECIKVWQGTRDKPVQIDEVEAFMEEYHKTHSVRVWGLDQHQSAATIQKFEKRRWNIKETFFTSSYNQEIYTALREAIYGDTIVLDNHELTLLELRFLRRIGVGRNFKVEAPTAGRVTTDDCADALANAHFLLKTLEGPEAFLEVSHLDGPTNNDELICPYCPETLSKQEGEDLKAFRKRFDNHVKECLKT